MKLKVFGLIIFLGSALIIGLSVLFDDPNQKDFIYSESKILRVICTPKRVGNFVILELLNGDRLSRNNTRSDLTCEELKAEIYVEGNAKIWHTHNKAIMSFELGGKEIFNLSETIEKKNKTRFSAILFLLLVSFFILVSISRTSRHI